MATGEKFLGSYEQKSTPEDTDLLVGYDVTNSKTKNFKLSAIWTWIKAKIGTAAFCSVVNNLTTAAEGGVLDARQGKALSDSLTKLNSLVGTTSISGIGGGTITGAISELNSKLFAGIFGANKTYTFNFNMSAILIFIRTNKEDAASGIISVDIYGSKGEVSGIEVNVENRTATVTNTSGIMRYCIGIIQ